MFFLGLIFNIGIPILPVLIKYDKYLYVEDSMVQTGLKLMSKSDININIDILDIEYPPFDKKKVNKIRNKMSKKGKLLLTNISSKIKFSFPIIKDPKYPHQSLLCEITDNDC